MKKTLLVVLLSSVMSSGAYAAACGAASATAIAATGAANTEMCICGGSTARKNTINGGSGAVVASPIFVKTGFDVQCSGNVFASFNEVSTTAFAVGAGSAKGNQTVQGNTAGGAVVVSAACPSTGCTGTQVTTAVTAGATAATSQ